MLIHPWDAVLDEQERRSRLTDGHDFGQLVVNGLPGSPPVVIPTHSSVEGTTTGVRWLVHLARPDPVWKNIDTDPDVVATVVDDHACIPTTWRARTGTVRRSGRPSPRNDPGSRAAPTHLPGHRLSTGGPDRAHNGTGPSAMR